MGGTEARERRVIQEVRKEKEEILDITEVQVDLAPQEMWGQLVILALWVHLVHREHLDQQACQETQEVRREREAHRGMMGFQEQLEQKDPPAFLAHQVPTGKLAHLDQVDQRERRGPLDKKVRRGHQVG